MAYSSMIKQALLQVRAWSFYLRMLLSVDADAERGQTLHFLRRSQEQ